MEKIKKLIIAILISIIVITLIIIAILNSKDQNGEVQMQASQGDAGEEIDFETTQVKDVFDKIEYYTVRDCINEYLSALNNQNSTYYFEDEFQEKIQEDYLYSLLSEEYVEDKNITKDNVLDALEISNEKQIFIPVKMRVLEKENVKKYVAYGIVQNLDNEFIRYMYIIVNLDFEDKTYSIEPLESNYNSIEDIEITNENKSIEENGYNTYIEQDITNQYVINEYLLLYKSLALSNPEIIYDLMSYNYKSNRFGSFEKFEEYINNNKEEISKINLSQYIVNNYDNYIEYVAKDQYGNIYIFNEYNENESLSLEIKLDTYTIATDKFKETYASVVDEKKVQMNIDKFFQMINRHDYKTAYSCLAESFKNNYFNTEEEFEEYAKERFFEYSSMEFKSYEKTGNDIYVFKVELKDLLEENSQSREINIIMQLQDDLDFRMSFDM